MIRINGHLGATLPAAFPAMAWQRQGSETVLTGVLDQPGLYAVLAEIEALGLDLLEVRQLATRDPDGTLFEFVEPRLPPGVGRQAS